MRATVVIDAFDVITSGTRRQETDPAIIYTAGWSLGNKDHPYSEGTAGRANCREAPATMTGSSARLLGSIGACFAGLGGLLEVLAPVIRRDQSPAQVLSAKGTLLARIGDRIFSRIRRKHETF